VKRQGEKTGHNSKNWPLSHPPASAGGLPQNKRYFQNQQQCRHELEQKPPGRAHKDGDIYTLKEGIATKYK
jgi:hypothetical protein